MGNFSSNFNEVNQNITNSILQSNSQNCISNATGTANNNTTIIAGNIKGNATGTSTTVKSDASCIIVSSLQSSIENILAAMSQQKNTSIDGIFNAFKFEGTSNINVVNQNINNNIMQLNQQLCQANAYSSASGNYTYVQKSATVNGNFIGASVESDASANCNMSNFIKNIIYNQEQSTNNQNNISKDAIAAVIGMIIAAFVVLGICGAVTALIVGKKPANKNPEDSTDQELQELNGIEGDSSNSGLEGNLGSLGNEFEGNLGSLGNEFEGNLGSLGKEESFNSLSGVNLPDVNKLSSKFF